MVLSISVGVILTTRSIAISTVGHAGTADRLCLQTLKRLVFVGEQQWSENVLRKLKGVSIKLSGLWRF